MKRFIKFSSMVFLGLACATLPMLAHEGDEEPARQTDEPVYSPGGVSHGNREIGESRGYRRRTTGSGNCKERSII